MMPTRRHNGAVRTHARLGYCSCFLVAGREKSAWIGFLGIN